MKLLRVLVSVAAASVFATGDAWAQQRWPLSLELGVGPGTGGAAGLYRSNDSGLTADATIGIVLASTTHGSLVAVGGIGVQGAGAHTDICIPDVEGRCIPSFPEFVTASALVGWETSHTLFRIAAGPGYVVSGNGAWSIETRVSGFLPVFERLAVGGTVRAALIPSYEDDSFRLISGQIVLRIR